jgi:REP element-mobilizing transposase RayT
MSRLRRLVLSDRYFFVTCNLLRTRAVLNEEDFEILARVMQARREEHGFLLTAWVFLPDHWPAILGPRYLKGLSLVMESVKVSSTRQINAARGELGRLWQGRFFDPAPLPLNIFVAGRRRALRAFPVAPVSSPATFGDGDIAATTPRDGGLYSLESAAAGTGQAAGRLEVVERP